MRIGDKEFVTVGAALAVLYAVYRMLEQPAVQVTPGPTGIPGGAWDGSVPYYATPNGAVYGIGGSGTPGAPSPAAPDVNVLGFPIPGFPPIGPWSPPPVTVDLTINPPGNQGYNAYFPLFGFVGVDSSQAFQ